jgi:hypothetical protein
MWPYLLSLYGLESTSKERELEKFASMSPYDNLEWRCKAVRNAILSKTECISGDIDDCKNRNF